MPVFPIFILNVSDSRDVIGIAPDPMYDNANGDITNVSVWWLIIDSFAHIS